MGYRRTLSFVGASCATATSLVRSFSKSRGPIGDEARVPRSTPQWRSVACGVRPALRAFTSLARCERTAKTRPLPRPSCAGPCGPRSACPSFDGHALRQVSRISHSACGYGRACRPFTSLARCEPAPQAPPPGAPAAPPLRGTSRPRSFDRDRLGQVAKGAACGVRPALRAFTSLTRCERTPKPRPLPRPSCAGPCRCSDQKQS